MVYFFEFTLIILQVCMLLIPAVLISYAVVFLMQRVKGYWKTSAAQQHARYAILVTVLLIMLIYHLGTGAMTL